MRSHKLKWKIYFFSRVYLDGFGGWIATAAQNDLQGLHVRPHQNSKPKGEKALKMQRSTGARPQIDQLIRPINRQTYTKPLYGPWLDPFYRTDQGD